MSIHVAPCSIFNLGLSIEFYNPLTRLSLKNESGVRFNIPIRKQFSFSVRFILLEITLPRFDWGVKFSLINWPSSIDLISCDLQGLSMSDGELMISDVGISD